ncbi:MIT domain-containing protein 1-like isoform X2 [Dreissena polymorpha]|uniref:MIT domain-containing protein 1-like isoform X2 n=1 Tax=Dreissena polymorpha TaxID=45954 RepID=UPI002264E89E|nr:MIT domain-containing protein 1-like isoform X2 [Dreissena polymorpha]
MSGMVGGMLTAATSVLTRAVELDTKARMDEAVVCYQEGLQLLMDVMKNTPAGDSKEKLREKVKTYMARAEELKKLVEAEKQAGKYHEQIHIENDSTGHSYSRLFGQFLDATLTEVIVEDPYIRSTHQLYNFLRFCEMVVKSEAKVRSIKLITGQDERPDQRSNQEGKLRDLATSLTSYNISLEWQYSNTLHDREIRRLSCSWVIEAASGYDDVIIQMEVLNSSLEYSLACVRDSVEIRDGDKEFHRSLASWCGATWPEGPLSTSRDKAYIGFSTDFKKNNYMGFILAYWLEKKPIQLTHDRRTVNYVLLGVGLTLLLAVPVCFLGLYIGHDVNQRHSVVISERKSGYNGNVTTRRKTS